jgi:hypothetical protein
VRSGAETGSAAADSGRDGRRAWGWRELVPLLVVLLLGTYPILRDLGGPLLWEDEGDTAVFASNIARFGLPRAWDGRTFTDSDYGERIAPRLFGTDFVMVGTPWLPFYAVAASFVLFGESAWSARLPFAVAGLATLVLLYALVRRATGDPRAALASAILLLFSTQFLLYVRECRHYALTMLLSVALLIAFLRLRDRPREWWLVIIAVLLFHTQILPAATTLAACGALTLIHPGFRAVRRPFWVRLACVVLLTAPWLPISWSAFGVNWNPVNGAADLLPRFAQFAIETNVAIPLVGWAIGIPLLWHRFSGRDREWLALAGAVFAACFAIVPWTLSRDVLITVALRYVAGLIPIAAGVTAILIARASRGRPAVFVLLLGLFGLTHLAGNALPSFLLGESRRIPGTQLYASVPLRTSGKIFNGEWFAFMRGLGVSSPGTFGRIVAILQQKASPGDVVITNYSWDNLYFHTRLPQGLRLPEGTPLHDAARTAGLPTYVFEPGHADWLIWRPAVDPIGNHTLEDLRTNFEARGARFELVAKLPDTTWENRPELTSHRFARDGFVFAPSKIGPFPMLPLEASVFRVHWP